MVATSSSHGSLQAQHGSTVVFGSQEAIICFQAGAPREKARDAPTVNQTDHPLRKHERQRH